MPEYDVVVVGGGPGGYIGAIRAAQLGLRTAVVERDEVGGVCLNWGCIPSKALLKNAEAVNLVRDASKWGITVDNPRYDMGAAIDRSRGVVDQMVKGVKYLFKKHKIDLYTGAGRLAGADRVVIDSTGETLQTKNVILATGARAKDLPSVHRDGEVIITSREALELKEPPVSVAIVGGGPVGVEFAYFWKAYGSDVTIIEMLPHLLPGEDEEVSKQIERSLKKLGIRFKTGATVEGVSHSNGKAVLILNPGEEALEVEKVMLGVGVAPNTEELGLEAVGIATDRGFIAIDERSMTNVPSVYAIGDVTGKMPLAHVASAQGVLAAEAIAGREPAPLDYGHMPRATYAQPQVASMGLSEKAAIEQGHDVKVGKFPFTANGKAVAAGHRDGFVKIVAEARHGEILGAHLVGHDVTDMLAELSVARMLEGTALEIGKTVHAHPTLSEAIMEAGLAVFDETLNI